MSIQNYWKCYQPDKTRVNIQRTMQWRYHMNKNSPKIKCLAFPVLLLVQILVPWKLKTLLFGPLPCPSVYDDSLETPCGQNQSKIVMWFPSKGHSKSFHAMPGLHLFCWPCQHRSIKSFHDQCYQWNLEAHHGGFQSVNEWNVWSTNPNSGASNSKWC